MHCRRDRVRLKRRVAHFELLEQLGDGHVRLRLEGLGHPVETAGLPSSCREADRIEIDSERFFREAEAAAKLEHPQHSHGLR